MHKERLKYAILKVSLKFMTIEEEPETVNKCKVKHANFEAITKRRPALHEED